MKTACLLLLMLSVALRAGADDVGEIRAYYGALLVSSSPASCSIVVDGYPFDKTAEPDSFDQVLAGTHTISFELSNKRLTQDIEMRRGETIVVRADFSMMSVEWYYASFQGITPEFAKLSGENGYWFGARVAGINEVSSFGGYDLRVGDIIVQINGVPFRTADDYFRMLWLIRPEVATAYTIVRDSTPFELVVRHLPRTYDNLAGWLMSHPEEYLRQR